MKVTSDLRPSAIAGTWYPADPKQLAISVDGYLNAAHLPDISGEILAVVAPHAGHVYSGPVAGYSFAALRGCRPQTVAVISPMHYPYLPPLLTTAHEAYVTPLGSIAVERDLLSTLDTHIKDQLGFVLSRVKNDQEHSLEIELPFLQRALSAEFKLLPVMVRDQTSKVARGLGSALAKTLKDVSFILVASTDLSHFYPQTQAKVYDGIIMRLVEDFDPQGVMKAEEEGRGFACGKAALASVLWAAKDLGADTVKVLHYATSGDITGDYSQVVGYGAAVITRQKH